MHEFVSFNHQIYYSAQAKISAISSAAFYGVGVFTTVAVYDSLPFLWEKHWQRLTENAKKLEIDLSEFAKQTVENSLLELLKKNNVLSGRVRLTFFDESSTDIWQPNSELKTSLLITTGNFRQIPRALKLTISPFRINSLSPIINTKSANYLENVLALREAKSRGYNEAIRLNENNEIVSACMANLFFIKNNEVFTPNLKTGALSGVTRGFVLENINVSQCQVNLEELESVENIFLTSTGLGIINVDSINSKTFSDSHIVKEINEIFVKSRNVSCNMKNSFDLKV